MVFSLWIVEFQIPPTKIVINLTLTSNNLAVNENISDRNHFTESLFPSNFAIETKPKFN